jgi:hypothetical protein
MMKHVNKVLVGCATTATNVNSMNVNDIAIFDKNGKLVTDATNVVKGEPFMFGVANAMEAVTLQDGSIVPTVMVTYGNVIDPVLVTNTPTLVPFKAPVEDVIAINMSGVFVTADYRYVLRILYKDIYELKSQFTKSFETVATATDTVATIAQRLVDQVNKDKGRRVIATLAGTTITLTALPKTDNQGKESLNTYSQVSMEATVYLTDPSALSSLPKASGAVVTKTQTADPGDGNPKVIRDRESEALGYKGITNRTHFPVIKPELRVNLGAQYYTLVIEFDSSYRSNDNQYVKTTPKTDEIYLDATNAPTNLWNIVKAYLGIA